MTHLVNNSCILVLDMLSCAMSACQGLLLCRPIADRFAPPMSAQVPSSGAANSGLQGDERWAAVAANLPNQTLTITRNCGRNRRKNGDANTCFWLNLTIFGMNTCTKRVGGWGVSILNSYFNSARRMQGLGERGGAIAPPARLRYSAAQGSVRTSREAAVPCAQL